MLYNLNDKIPPKNIDTVKHHYLKLIGINKNFKISGNSICGG